jgi:HPt (histidine-containing phosphotransfer) domain-containing protein
MLPTFDRATFYEVCGLDLYGADIACQVIDIFIEHTPSPLDALDMAIRAHDGPAAQRILHQLKGGAAGMGGLRLADLCSLLQRYGDAPPVPTVMEGQRIREASADLVAALREERTRLSAHQ